MGVLAASQDCSLPLNDFLEGIAEKYRPIFLRGFGYGIDTMINSCLPNTGDVYILFDGLSKVINQFTQLKKEYKGYIYTGYVSNSYVFNIWDLEDDYFLPSLDLSTLFCCVDNKIDKFYRPYIYMGIGENLGLDVSYRRLQFERAVFLLNKINKGHKAYAFQGFGRGVRFMFDQCSQEEKDLIQKVPVEYRKDFLEGIEK